MKNVAIEVLNGPMDGYRFKMALSSDKPLTIGRLKEKDVILPDIFVSRSHAQISYDNGKYWLEDYSRYGTVIEDKKIHKSRVELPAGTVFKVGNTLLKFEEVSEQEEIADQLWKLSHITEGITQSELKDLKEHHEIKEIEKRLGHAMSEKSDLKDLVAILKDLLETVQIILKKSDKDVQPIPPPQKFTEKTPEEIKDMTFKSIRQVLEKSLEEKHGANK